MLPTQHDTYTTSAGCYGENLHMAYQPEKQPLLDRGWVLVYCHIRGGGELGRKGTMTGWVKTNTKALWYMNCIVMEYLK